MKTNFLIASISLLVLTLGACDKKSNTNFTPIYSTGEVPTTDVKATENSKATTTGIFSIPASEQDYYQGVDFTKTGLALKQELTELSTRKHVRELSYKEIWEATKATDLTPEGNEVYLLYGHKGVRTGTTAYTRGKQSNGGGQGQWNREHTYAKSLGTPNLNEAGPGADAHHLRAADVKWNSIRGNKPFVQGSGTSKLVGDYWYPGDEWKGDVARMMMYMYIRYENRCIPKYTPKGNNGRNAGVVVGTTNKIDPNMINLLLEWNAEDPVSEIERYRNEYHANTKNKYAQGNRNPFIDNPYLATRIWGGPEAKNNWSKE